MREDFNAEDMIVLAQNITDELTKLFSHEWSLDVQKKVKETVETEIGEYFVDPEIL